MEHDIMGRVAEKGRSTRHGCENATFPFDAQVLIDPRTLRDPMHRQIRIDGYGDVSQTICQRISIWGGGDHGLQMRQEIGKVSHKTAKKQGPESSGDDIAAHE